MGASGEGTAANSASEMAAWMELEASDEGVVVDCTAEPDVFGRIAQFGERAINPVANRAVNEFFDNVADH
jgi:carbon monoxide dehydrogenase subunit G